MWRTLKENAWARHQLEILFAAIGKTAAFLLIG